MIANLLVDADNIAWLVVQPDPTMTTAQQLKPLFLKVSHGHGFTNIFGKKRLLLTNKIIKYTLL